MAGNNLISAKDIKMRLGIGLNPTNYGLPNLLRRKKKNETVEDFEAWRKKTLKNFVENRIWFIKDGKIKKIITIPPMIDMLYELFYLKVRRAILWKPRGGGGSLIAAVFIWLMMIYRQMSFLDLAGSAEQAQNVYEYTKQFWDCFPKLRDDVLVRSPLANETKMKTFTSLKCISTSQTAARGKHKPGFVGDEACQEQARASEVFEAAMDGLTSEENNVILLCSTFHYPFGFFADYWDNAEEKGFKHYKWDIFDTMKTCDANIDCKKCFLTEKREVIDPITKKVITHHYVGCNGKARTTKGFTSRGNVILAKKRNILSFDVEYGGERPEQGGRIYNENDTDIAIIDEITIKDVISANVGILFVETEEYILIPEVIALRGAPIGQIKQICGRWRTICKRWGIPTSEFQVYPDGEDAYNCKEIELAHYIVYPVHFVKHKSVGIGNVGNYLIYRKLKILNKGDAKKILKKQMKKYHRDDKGKIVKKDDHGPDCLMAGLLRYNFLKKFYNLLMQSAAEEDLEAMKSTLNNNKEGNVQAKIL